MVAGIAEGFFAGLHPEISQEVRVGLNRISLVIVVGGVDQFEPQVVPDGFDDELADVEDIHASLRTGETPHVQGSF